MVIHDLWSMRGDHKHSIVANARNNHSYIKRNKCLRIAGMLASFNLFLIALVTVFPIQLRHMTAEATEDASSTPSLTMIQGHESASVNLLVSSSTGTFATSSADQLAEFSVASSNQSGYTLTIVGNDDEGALKDSNTNNALSTITDKTSISAFDNSIFNGKWGYRPSKYNSVANEDFYPSPTTEASTLDKTNQPNQETPNVYTIGLGARADYSTSAGSYTGSYTLQAIGNVVPYTIYFVDDTNDSTAANLPTSIIGSTQDSTITLPSTLPTRTGYTFGGWCSVLTTLDASGNSVCSGGTLYDRGGEFPISQLSSSESTLHATWQADIYDITVNFADSNITNVVFSAEGQVARTVSSSGGKASLAYGVQYSVLVFFSNSEDYSINNWSLNNAEYGILTDTSTNPAHFTPNAQSSNAVITVSSKNNLVLLQDLVTPTCPTEAAKAQDIRDGQSYYVKKHSNGDCWMMENLNLGAANLRDNLSSENTNISTTISTTEFSNWEVESSKNTYNNAEYITLNSSNTTNGLGNDELNGNAYGTLYNYCAASGQTICESTNVTATYDVCPAGWRLPTTQELEELSELYNTVEKIRAPIESGGFGFVLAGRFSPTITNQGTSGHLWSSSPNGTSQRRLMTVMKSGTITPDGYINRSYGASIRCILKESYLINYLDGTEDETVNNLPNQERAYLPPSTSILSSQTPTRDGYTFLKWCLGTVSDNGTTCSGTTYNPGEELNLVNVGGDHNANLLAIWSPNISINKPTSIQSTSLNNINCEDEICTITGLSKGETYSLSATPTDGYAFKGWQNTTSGTIADNQASGMNTTFTVGAYPTIIQPIAQATTNRNVTVKIIGSGAKYNNLVTFTSEGQISRTISNEEATVKLSEGAEYTIKVSPSIEQYVMGNWSINDSSYGTLTILDSSTHFTPNSTSDNAVLSLSIDSLFIQDTISAQCGENVSTVLDIRDNKEYKIQRLKDGNCWMLDNLSLGSSQFDADLTSANTNIPNGTTITASSFYSWNEYVSSHSYTSPKYTVLSTSNTSNRLDRDANSNTAYGNSYNFCAASAGTVCSSNVSPNAVSDICPAGWRLPIGGPAGEFVDLYSKYNSSTSMRASAENGGASFGLAGTLNSSTSGSTAGKPTNQGTHGYYWSSTQSVYGSSTYTLYMSASTVYPEFYNGRDSGHSIRCVLKESPSISYIDNTGDSSVSNLPEATIVEPSATSVTLTSNEPSRDNFTLLNWCSNKSSNNGVSCSGTSYAANSTMPLDVPTKNFLNLYAVWSPNITIKTVSGISNISLNGVSCSSDSGCVVTGLQYNNNYTLTATVADGYTFSSFDRGSYGSISNISTSGSTVTATYTVGINSSIITPSVAPNKYAITLNNSLATTSGSTSARATYNANIVYGGTSGTSNITSPQRKYTISGFYTNYNNASGASVSSSASITSEYDFEGWYTEPSGGNKIIENTSTLVADTDFTDSEGKWINLAGTTLYSQWSGGNTSLPTISKSGYTCGWTTSTNTSSIMYASGYSGLVPTANMTLYGVCNVTEYDIILENTSATLSGSTSARVSYGSGVVYGGTSGTSNITSPQRKYTISGFYTNYNNASGASVSDTISLTSIYLFNGWYTATANGSRIITSDSTLVSNTNYTDSNGKWDKESGAKLYAQWDNSVSSASLTLPTISKSGYTCGWTTSTNTSSIMYASGYSGLVPTANMTLYGVCTANTHSVRVNFAGSGVSSVTFTASGQTSRTVSTSGDTVSLVEGVQYTVTMNLSDNNEFGNWDINNASYGTLGTKTTNPTTFTPNANSNSAIIVATGIEGCSMRISGVMQNYSLSNNMCGDATGTLTDNRDNQDYTVAVINNRLWMTRNLAIGCNGAGSVYSSDRIARDLSSSNSNISGNWSTNSARNLVDSTSTSEDLNYPYMQCDSTYGAWYNYVAVTAGTITGYYNYTEASSSICPAGWRLPTHAEQASIANNANFATTFNPIAGGFYGNGHIDTTEGGWWWSSTADKDAGDPYGASRYVLQWYNNSLTSDGQTIRDWAMYARCILDN